MFDRISEAAEKLATNVSRRAFLGRLGQAALATAGVLGAGLAFGGEAKAQHSGFCEVVPHMPGGGWDYNGFCRAGCTLGRSSVCRGGYVGFVFTVCLIHVGSKTCTF